MVTAASVSAPTLESDDEQNSEGWGDGEFPEEEWEFIELSE